MNLYSIYWLFQHNMITNVY